MRAIIIAAFGCLPVAAKTWPAPLEKGFQERCRYVIESTTRERGFGNTFFENEKRSYGWAMLSILGGEKEAALRFLESEDANAKDWNRVTLGIDFFPAFTLKHQTRKYFHFGDQLTPAYLDRMKKAAAIFTERDPYRRPHPAFKKGTPGWTPEAHNSWVDIRNTDNLKLMRETSVYLFAEDAGNEEVRKVYAGHLRRFVHGLYHVGMSEWDSENYLGHSMVPLINLHDFAKDPEIKQLAKAGLDWMTITGALKYRHGIWGGPTKRDYNHPTVFGGSAAMLFWLWFGDAKLRPTHFESDEVHLITSNYRPPVVAVEIACKKGLEGQTVHACKPGLESWNDFEVAVPIYRETHYFGRSYQLGTLLKGTQNPDVNGFKLLVDHPDRGADAIVAAPCSEPALLGSPMYKSGLLARHSSVGQNRNLAVYLTADAEMPYHFWVPSDALVSRTEGGVTVLRCASSSIAIWPINTTVPEVDVGATKAVRTDRKGKARWPHLQVMKASRIKKMAYGFAIEVAHTPTDQQAKAFARIVAGLKPDVLELRERSAVTMTGTAGQRLRLQWGENPLAISVWADGKASPFNDHREAFVFRGELIDQAWQGGSMKVAGEVFAPPSR